MKIRPQTTDPVVLAELGRRLERVRLDRNLSQEDLADEAGISRSSLWRIETGREYKVNALIRVLRALGMLEALELLVPEPVPSPIEQLDRHGKQRQRARRSPDRGPDDGEEWTWGADSTGGTT